MKSLSFNLMMARLACVHIRRAIASSTNLTGVHRPMLLDRSRIASDEKRQLRQRNESWFAEYDNQLLEQHQLSSTWRVPRSFRLSQMRFHAALAMKSGVGNCGEMSAAAFLFLAQSNLFPLDLLHVNYRSPAQFGHAFLVIGRDGDVSLAEPWNWGESAVVCDPWNNAVFPVTAYHYYAHYFPQSFRHLMVNQLVRLMMKKIMQISYQVQSRRCNGRQFPNWTEYFLDRTKEIAPYRWRCQLVIIALYLLQFIK